MTVASGVGFGADPGEDPEPVQQGLQAAHQILPDHVHFHHGRTCPCGDEALGLENAAQVGGATGSGASKSCAGTSMSTPRAEGSADL